MAQSGFDVIDDITSLKSDLKKLYNCQSKGCIIRSRIQHLESNEKCTRYFFKKLIAPKKSMDSLKTQEGEVVTEIQHILPQVHNFFQDLYNKKNIDNTAVAHFLSRIGITNRNEADPIDSDLTVDDLTKALNSMQNNKSPGADGLPKEFYTMFWDELKDSMLAMFKESLHLQILPPSLREGVISLIYKKGDTHDLKCWRPLTMLGVDVKILSKALFFRLQPVISNYIEGDQTCGIKGRSLRDNLALVRDVFLYAEDRKAPLCILALDFEKAFDCIDYNYLHSVLQRFGFGSTIRAWIDLLYKDCQSRVLINGFLTDSFHIRSGLRQGCGLSPLLFILAIEPLACAIRQDLDIKGFLIPGCSGREAKLSIYMDDLSLLLTDNRSVVKVLQTCDRFSLASGIKINKTKSEVLYLNWKEPELELGLKIQKDSIKILGLSIGKGMDIINWNSRLPKLKWKLKQWEGRDLTLRGKVLVINAEILASLSHLATTFPVPMTFLRSVKKIIFHFLWGSQHERLKRLVLCKPLEKGGLALPDIEAKLDAMFLTPIVKAVLCESSNLWACFSKFWVGRQILRVWGMRIPQNTPYAEHRPAIYDRALSLLGKIKLTDPCIDRLNRVVVEGNLTLELTKIIPIGKFVESDCIMIWRNVNDSFLSNSHKDIAWQTVHQCLPTRIFLDRRNCSRTKLCPHFRCGDDETVSHLFWGCQYAKDVWLLLQPWLKKLYRVPSEKDILFGELSRVNSKIWIRWWAVINAVKEGIWKARNISVFKKFDIPVKSVVSSSNFTIQEYILRDKKSKSGKELHSLWKIPNHALFRSLLDIL
ncbi:MAG: reverse transcriptase domain-containing protein, partial [Aeromonas sp.]